jgi:hypothetical protein
VDSHLQFLHLLIHLELLLQHCKLNLLHLQQNILMLVLVNKMVFLVLKLRIHLYLPLPNLYILEKFHFLQLHLLHLLHLILNYLLVLLHIENYLLHYHIHKFLNLLVE